MKTLFADTGYWIALLHPSDALHQRSMRLSAALEGHQIVTSELVLIELLNYFAKRGSSLRKAAAALTEEFQSDRSVELVPVDSRLVQDSLWLYRQRSDKNWSLTDCSSFVIMRQLGLSEALTYDSHFQQAGFRAILRDNF